jgi:hypothetical protein
MADAPQIECAAPPCAHEALCRASKACWKSLPELPRKPREKPHREILARQTWHSISPIYPAAAETPAR